MGVVKMLIIICKRVCVSFSATSTLIITFYVDDGAVSTRIGSQKFYVAFNRPISDRTTYGITRFWKKVSFDAEIEILKQCGAGHWHEYSSYVGVAS